METYMCPLYRKSSNLPYGRRDRWLALWDIFYYLYVFEKSDKWILEFLVPVLNIVLIVATWWIGGQGAWIAELFKIGKGIAAGISLGISLSLNICSLAGNKTFSFLNNIWGLTNFIGLCGYNDWNFAVDFTKNTAQAAQEITSFEAALNISSNILNGAGKVFNIIQNISADTPNMINEEDNTKENSNNNSSQAQELAKNEENPTIWYSLDTTDILNEKPKQRNNIVFIF